jgi:signal transduction histidine kinase
MNPRLPVRIFASYAVVIVVGAASAYLTVRLLEPPLFDHRMGSIGGRGGVMGMGRGADGVTSSTHAALISALNTALLVAVVASVAASGIVAAFVATRLLRPLESVRAATRRIADGEYDTSVPVPREPELAALATDVNALGRTLAQTEVRRTRLLGDVAHEMRTPLTTLDGYVEALIDNVLPPTVENLSALSDELRRLHRLADDLSALSRTEEGRIELRRVDTDLAALTRQVCERLRAQFDDAGVTLQIRADAGLLASIDPDRIAQVLTNLLGNAIVATPAGGTVTVSCSRHGDGATVQVSDTGVGMTAADTERIFERFYRAPNQPRRSSGSGVGLTIARDLARLHGGDLTARSDGPGLGATFSVSLPLLRAS